MENQTLEIENKQLASAQDLSYVSPNSRSNEIVEKAYNGSSKDQFNLAMYFIEGSNGFRRSKECGVYWLTQAVINGETLAFNQLGLCYLEGRGVIKNEPLAYEFLKIGAEKGDVIAMVNAAILLLSGRGTSVDYHKAAEFLAEAINYDYAPAAYQIGQLYLHGKGVEKDTAVAFAYFMQAVNAGVDDAHSALAHCYSEGIGTEVDLQKAREHWIAGCKAGDAVALRCVGERHLTGADGFSADPEKGRSFLLHAASEGDPEAQYKYAQCCDKGIGGPVSIEERDKWSARAYEQGHVGAIADAQNKLKEQTEVDNELNKFLDKNKQIQLNQSGQSLSNEGTEGTEGTEANPKIKRRSRIFQRVFRRSASSTQNSPSIGSGSA